MVKQKALKIIIGKDGNDKTIWELGPVWMQFGSSTPPPALKMNLNLPKLQWIKGLESWCRDLTTDLEIRQSKRLTSA